MTMTLIFAGLLAWSLTGMLVLSLIRVAGRADEAMEQAALRRHHTPPVSYTHLTLPTTPYV